jgi:uncharacterized membrane protein YtjA (UPF0391 family)
MLTLLSSALVAQVATGGLGTILWFAIVFFILAIVAYLFGANGVAGMSAGVGRSLLFVFLILAVLFMVIGLFNHPTW